MKKRTRKEILARHWRRLIRATSDKAPKKGSDSKASKGKNDGSTDSDASGTDNRSK